MSIEFSYTGHGTIRIQCGGEVLEVPIEPPGPAGSGATAPSAPPVIEPPAPGGRPTRSTLPGDAPRVPWPKPPPGVLGVVTIGAGKSSGTPGESMSLRQFREDDLFLPIAEVVGQPMVDIRRHLYAVRKPRGPAHVGSVILNVGIRPDQWTKSINVGDMQSIVDDPSLGIAAIRLMYLPGEDTS